MSIKEIVFTYFIMAAFFLAVDLLWLGLIAKKFYQKHLGRFFSDRVHWRAAMIFYVLFIAGVRETLGDGKLFGYMVFGPRYLPALLMILSPGAFITIGIIMGWFNTLDERARRRSEAAKGKR